MAISERVARLRQESLDALPRISAERAELITNYGSRSGCFRLLKTLTWLLPT